MTESTLTHLELLLERYQDENTNSGYMKNGRFWFPTFDG
jgi:hypothetical protein